MKKATILVLILAIASLFFDLLIYALYYGYGNIILLLATVLNSLPVIILALIILYNHEPTIFDKLKGQSKFIRLPIIFTVILTLLPLIIPDFFIDKGNAFLFIIFIALNGAIWGFSLVDFISTLHKNKTFIIRKLISIGCFIMGFAMGAGLLFIILLNISNCRL